jgi:3'(2'), 5'-bisphosphate nucleotidase
MQDTANFLLSAVRAAARATRFVHASSAIDGLDKADASPVTIADWSSQAVVALLLARDPAWGSLPLVGEEDASSLRTDESRPLLDLVVGAVSHAIGPVEADAVLDAIDRGRGAAGERFLTLDPVDGTKGFLRRQQYAISLGLIEAGRPVAGAVGCPNLALAEGRYDQADATGSFAGAVLGEGAFLEVAPGERRAVRIADWSAGQPIRACESFESAHSRQDLSVELLAAVGAPGTPARLDSQAKYVVVARGGADIYMRLPVKPGYREKIWDHAAGALVASEAGARVTDVDGRPLDFGQGRELTANRGVFAGHPAIVDALATAYAARFTA